MLTPLINYSRSGKRRVDISVGISYGDDLEKVRKITIESLENVDKRNKDRPVELFFTEFGDSSINFTVRFWMKFSNSQKEYWEAVSDAIMKIKGAYDKNDISIPFPIRTLDFGIKGGKTLQTQLKK